MREFSVTQENYSMNAQVKIIGKDLFISITGGDSPHIGSVTTLTNNSQDKTLSFPSHDGRLHKDGILAQQLAKVIKSFLPGNCVITSGVHVDQITQKQIMVSGQMAEQLGQEILKWIKEYDFDQNYIEPKYYSDDEQPR